MPVPGDETFGSLLARTRRQAGLTQEELAARAGTSVRAVRNIERGAVRRPHLHTVRVLAKALALRDDDTAYFVARARGQVPAHPARPVAGVVPAQLPADLADFTGRPGTVADAVALLTGRDEPGTPVLAVAGSGGSGKSALAVHVAHRARTSYPDGQLYVGLRGASERPVDPGDALATLLAGLGVGGASLPTSTTERAAVLRSLLADKRMLLVVDDARDAAQVRPLLPGAGGCAVLVTSRRSLVELTPTRHIELTPLDHDEGVALFTGIIGASRAGGEPDATATVVRTCGGLPLAIRLAAGRLAARPRWTVTSLADRLADSRHRLDELRAGDLQVRSSFELSYRNLSNDVAHAFRTLGVLDHPAYALDLAAALIGRPVDVAEKLLDELVDVHLLDSPAPGRYRLHDLLHSFARELAADQDSADVRTASLARALDHATAATVDATAALRPYLTEHEDTSERFALSEHAMAWYAESWDELSSLARQAVERPALDRHQVARLLAELAESRSVAGRWQLFEEFARAGLALAVESGDEAAMTRAHLQLGWALTNRGATTEAAPHQEEALAGSRQLGLRALEANALVGISDRLLHDRDLDEALRRSEEARAIWHDLGHGSGEALALEHLAKALDRAGRYDEAVARLERGVALVRRRGDRRTEAFQLNSLAYCYIGLDRPADAIEPATRCVEIGRAIGHANLEGAALDTLAEAYAVIGELELARQHFENALDRLVAPRGRGKEATLIGLGHVLHALGDTAGAKDRWREALAQYDGDEPQVADLYRLLADPDAEVTMDRPRRPRTS
ncbi:MAG: tetratricopeptide repeat protein [Streptosporangiales bacterium]|nr:tetratricopeptide repeat protein [Streptosporangiales bacterium]